MTALVGRHLCRPEGFRSDTLCESRPIDLQILEYPLNIIARFRERDAFDPVDWIDFGVTRIAVLRDPFLHPATPRIVAGEDQDKGAAVVSHQSRELGRSKMSRSLLNIEKRSLPDVKRRWLGEQGRRVSFCSGVRAERHVRLEVACEPSVVESLWRLPS